MENKLLINKMKNAPELAQAAYGYYDLMTNSDNQLFIEIKNENNKDFIRKEIILADIMDSTFADYKVYKPQLSAKFKPDVVGTLKGDMTPTQTKRFFDKYDLLDFYPKFDNKNNKQQKGFHACLFQDKESKESKEYTLAIRGSFDSKDYVEADFLNLLARSSVPKDYFEKMLNFYYQCAEKYPAITKPKSLNVVGHSLGGCLAQLFALSFANYAKRDCGIINEVYTFNSPGARELNPLSYGILEISLPNLSSYDKDSKKQYIKDFIKTLDISFIESRIQQEGLSQNDVMWGLHNNLYYELYGLVKNAKEALHIYLSVDIEYEEKPAGDMEEREYYATLTQIDSYYALAYKTLIDNYYFHKEKKQGVDIGLPTYHIETDSDNNPNNLENKLIQNLGEDIEGKHYYLNIGIDVEGMERHSIKSSVVILYFYEYLLDLEANREKLSNSIKTLESKPQDSITLHYIGHKASKNKGKYQLITALFNDFMQWNYNSLKEVNKEVLKEVKKEYKERKKTNKDTPKSPEKIFPLVYLLSEVSYIARFKDSKKVQEFDMYKMIDSITQLQEAKLYVKVLDKAFFDGLENKQCSVAELRCVLKCQPFIVVDENNQEVLNENNRAEIFYYKTFNNLVSQILQSYKTA